MTIDRSKLFLFKLKETEPMTKKVENCITCNNEANMLEFYRGCGDS